MGAERNGWLRLATTAIVGCAMLGIVPSTASAIDVTISNTKRQTVQGFGTCIAWWVNSPYDQDAWRNMYAQDAGCSVLRVELHPNIAKQNTQDLTTAPALNFTGVLQDDINRLNWTAQGVANAVSLESSLNQKKLDQFRVIGSLWTPPHWMKTSSGPDDIYIKTRGGSGESCKGHLINDANTRTQPARYIAAYVKGFEQKSGVPFHAISIQNELAFPEPYNSCVYYAKGWQGTAEYPVPLKAVKAEFSLQGITTRIFGPEHEWTWGGGNNQQWQIAAP